MTGALAKPPARKTSTTIEVFSIEQPVELMSTKDSSGKVTQHWRMATFYFTTHDNPVSANGHQYIPLSFFDQIKWDEIVKASNP